MRGLFKLITNTGVILRSDLKQLNSTGRSLMPDGFENSLNPQALADLIAFIRSNPSKGSP